MGRANSVDPPVREGQRTLNRADQSVANVPPLRAADALAALDAADTGPRREVLVLGAGMAGLAAAYEFSAADTASRYWKAVIELAAAS